MIQLDDKEFIELVTYNGLFDHISLVGHPGILAALQAQPNDSAFHLDGVELYTFDGWITECRRRREMAAILAEAGAKVKMKPTPTIDEQILDAIKAGDISKAMTLIAEQQQQKP